MADRILWAQRTLCIVSSAEFADMLPTTIAQIDPPIPPRWPTRDRALVPRNEHPPFRKAWRSHVAKKASRRRYTAAEKKNILAVAAKEGLTGADVQKKFGIAQLTFYRWRGPVRGPKARAAAAPASAVSRGAARGGATLDSIRAEVRAGVQAVIPQVIREEVANYLNDILGRRGPGRPKGSGRGPGRPKGSGRKPGRPKGVKRGPGRPPKKK